MHWRQKLTISACLLLLPPSKSLEVLLNWSTNLRDCVIRIFWNRVPHFGSPKRVLVLLRLRFRPPKCAQNALKKRLEEPATSAWPPPTIHLLPPPVPPITSTLPPQQMYPQRPLLMWSPRCLSSLQPAVVRTLPAPLARCLDADARCQYNTTMHPKTMLPAPTVRLQPQLNSMHTAPTAAAAAVSPTDAGHSHLIERFYVQ